MNKLLITLLLAGMFSACAPTTPAPAPTVTVQPEQVEADMISQEAQLMTMTETQEEAEELAELYGITLVRYRHGVARFRTDDDPQAVIRRGEENGWPQLTLNRTTSTS